MGEEAAAALWDRAVQAMMSGGGPELTPILQQLMQLHLPLTHKYRQLDVASLLGHNAPQDAWNTVGTAFNILEKYGRNLLSPSKPKFWRAVKFNNPVFKTTVDAVKGGREILHQYGYTVEQRDGLSFPEVVEGPDLSKVAAVTMEVALLQAELGFLRQGSHPHPDLFSQFVHAGTQEVSSPMSPQPTQPTEAGTAATSCAVCSTDCVTSHCRDCVLYFCGNCDTLYHRHPARSQHQRHPTTARPPPGGIGGGGDHGVDLRTLSMGGPGRGGQTPGTPPSGPITSPSPSPSPSPSKRHSPGLSPSLFSPPASPFPGLSLFAKPFPSPSPSPSPARSPGPSLFPKPTPGLPPSPILPPSPGASLPPSLAPPRVPWACQACTFHNQPSSVLCSACDRPRLAARPPASPSPSRTPGSTPVPALSGTPASPSPSRAPASTTAPAPPKPGGGWQCGHCTFINPQPGRICLMCDRTMGEGEPPAPGQAPPLPAPGPAPAPAPGPRGGEGEGGEGAEGEARRQQRLREDGQRLVHAIRLGEKGGLIPEEVVGALVGLGGPGGPGEAGLLGGPGGLGEAGLLAWVATELPQVLERVGALAGVGAAGLSGGEARRAWIDSGGNEQEAATRGARDRLRKVRELQGVLGGEDEGEIHRALYVSGGNVEQALMELQRQRLLPFTQRLWDSPPPTVDTDHPDRERVLRQILATYSLPSWGRAEIVLSLMQEGSDHYQLPDVVEAVKDSQDREFIKRSLSLPCVTCFNLYPRSKMQSLTSCECTICHECFQRHFTIVVRERHIKDLVCPSCSQPDINDPAQSLNYFSTLDIQLRDCLDGEVYDLFHKKLTERSLMMDPKFRWCTHCSNGFIYDGQNMRVTCPQCQGSFCVECRRPWEPQHQGIGCEEFQNWKRENDPEYQAQGLAAYLRDNGIDCPNCRFRYALARGGCMHFTCSQCQHEFCSGCYNPFLSKKHKCTEPWCNLKESLHAHHPRDCLSYLRDWSINTLQELLTKHAVPFDTEPPQRAEAAPGGLCGVMQQREEGERLTDAACGSPSAPGHAGLCQSHYKEYLVSCINGHSLDPAEMFTDEELERYLATNRVKHPPRVANEGVAQYMARLLKVVMTIPLGDKVPRHRK